MGAFIQNIPGVSVGDVSGSYTPSGFTDTNTATASQGSIWSQIGGFVNDLGNLGLNIYHAVNVPTPTVPKSTLPQGSLNTSGLFGSGTGSLLLILAVVFGGIFLLRKAR